MSSTNDARNALNLAEKIDVDDDWFEVIKLPNDVMAIAEPGHWQHGEIGSSTYTHLYEQLLKLKDTMNTQAGRALAETRHAFMQRFAEQFEREWAGEI